MGWNAGYAIFESTVVGAYDLGVLDRPLLRVLMEPYRNTDIDAGGKEGLTSKDGLEVEEIVVKVWGGTMPPRPGPAGRDFATLDAYREASYQEFRKVTKEFGWW